MSRPNACRNSPRRCSYQSKFGCTTACIDIGTHAIRIRFVDEDNTELLGGEGSVKFGEPAAGVTEVEAGAERALPFWATTVQEPAARVSE